MNGMSYREFLELKLGIELPSYTLKEILDNNIESSMFKMDNVIYKFKDIWEK